MTADKHDREFLERRAADLPLCRRIVDENEPGAVWDADREIWLESDAAFRKRILDVLDASPLPHVVLPNDIDV